MEATRTHCVVFKFLGNQGWWFENPGTDPILIKSDEAIFRNTGFDRCTKVYFYVWRAIPVPININTGDQELWKKSMDKFNQ